MATTRQLSNGQKLTDWTTEVNDIDNQYGLINGSGLFSGKGTSQLTIVFDKTTNQIRLLNQRTRAGQGPSRNNDRKVETFSLSLPYYLHADYVTPQDIQDHRMAGTPDSKQTLANAIATKLEDMRYSADQTREYMKLNALKAVTTSGEGAVLADMFDEFGKTAFGAAVEFEQDFTLGSDIATVENALSALKRKIATNAKMGGRIGRIEVMVTPEFFDALTTHSGIRAAYIQYQVKVGNSDVVRADLARYEAWGVVDTFMHKGIMFYSYDPRFDRDNGVSVTEVRGLGALAGEDANSRDGKWSADPGSDALRRKLGYTVVSGVKDLYKGVFGPSNTLSGANQVGSEMIVTQSTDPKDKFHEMELEMSNLYYMTRPQVSIKVFTSN